MPTLYWRGGRGPLLELLHRLPPILCGRATDPTGIVQSLQRRIGVAAMSDIQRAYTIKSDAGTDDMGIKWKELSLVTLAIRRSVTTPESVRRLRHAFRRMTPKQRRRVRKIQKKIFAFYTTARFSRQRRKARKILGLMRSRRRPAERITESLYRKKLRELTGRARLGEYKILSFSMAMHKILKDTGVLFASFSPGEEDRPSGAEGQVFEIGPGFVIVGSNVRYFPFHQSALPRQRNQYGQDRLPRRQVLPDDTHPVPDIWWEHWLDAFRRGLAVTGFFEEYLRRG